MSSHPENVDMSLADQVVMANHLAVNIIYLPAAVMSLDPIGNLGRTSDEDILHIICQLIPNLREFGKTLT